MKRSEKKITYLLIILLALLLLSTDFILIALYVSPLAITLTGFAILLIWIHHKF